MAAPFAYERCNQYQNMKMQKFFGCIPMKCATYLFHKWHKTFQCKQYNRKSFLGRWPTLTDQKQKQKTGREVTEYESSQNTTGLSRNKTKCPSSCSSYLDRNRTGFKFKHLYQHQETFFCNLHVHDLILEVNRNYSQSDDNRVMVSIIILKVIGYE